MRTHLRTLLIVLLLPAAVVVAQEDTATKPAEPPARAITAHSEFRFGVMEKILLRAAELMPEEQYDFKPTDEVRTFGQILGHVADSQYYFCSSVLGEESPSPRVEETKTRKADLLTALQGAFAYCARGYEGLNDASGGHTVQLSSGGTPKLSVLDIDQVHTIEHYGNLIVYLRMNGIVPPTSDPEFMAQFRE